MLSLSRITNNLVLKDDIISFLASNLVADFFYLKSAWLCIMSVIYSINVYLEEESSFCDLCLNLKERRIEMFVSRSLTVSIQK